MVQNTQVSCVLEWMLARGKQVQQASQSPNIWSFVWHCRVVLINQLWRSVHLSRRFFNLLKVSLDLLLCCFAVVDLRLACAAPEISELEHISSVKHVFDFDVSMAHTLSVQVLYSFAYLQHNRADLVCRKRIVTKSHHVVNKWPITKLTKNVRAWVIVKFYQVWMIKRGPQLDFILGNDMWLCARDSFKREPLLFIVFGKVNICKSAFS